MINPRTNRQLGAVIFAIAAIAALAGAQTVKGRLEPPDVYEFAPPFVHVPRYEHDEKREKIILNPDFYCTACVEQGRILVQSRDELKDRLEVTKRYPLPLQGRTEDHFGQYRLMEHGADNVLRYLFEHKKSKSPVFIEDAFFRIYTDLGSFNTKMPSYPRREIELEQLHDIFPKVSKKTVVLDPHHRAHLYLIRAHRVLRDFSGLVDHRDDKGYMDFIGPYLGMKQKWEIFIFRKKNVGRHFALAYLGQHLEDGICWHTLKDDSMVAMMHAQGRKDVELNNTFTHRLSFNLITGFRGYRFDLPSWLTLGYAHLMERRERTDFNTFIFGEGRIPSFSVPSKWKVAVRKLVANDDLRPFQEIADITSVARIKPREHLVVWSQVSYLLQRDQKKAGEFISLFKTRKKGESMRNLVIRCLRLSFGITMTRFFEDWKQWVLDTYPAA